MSTCSSFNALTSGTCAIRRPATIVANRRSGTSTVIIASIGCLPLISVDHETRLQAGLDSNHEILQTFIQGDPDVRKGDILETDGFEYPIRFVARWPIHSDILVHVIIEKVNRQ